MMYLSIDPGAGRTDSIGWALFNTRGHLTEAGQTTFDGLVEMLENWVKNGVVMETVVCEDYRIRRSKISSHVGSRVETIQTIGVIRGWCARNNFKMHLQPSRILPIAEKHFGITMPSDHTQSHQIAAILHGLWYLHSIGKVKTVLEENPDAASSH